MIKENNNIYYKKPNQCSKVNTMSAAVLLTVMVEYTDECYTSRNAGFEYTYYKLIQRGEALEC